MSAFRTVKSADALTIVIEGDRRRPEPSSAIIEFPGGSVEVSRTSAGDYWVHVSRRVEAPHDGPAGVVTDSRIDFTHEANKANGGEIPRIPWDRDIQHIAVRIARAGGSA